MHVHAVYIRVRFFFFFERDVFMFVHLPTDARTHVLNAFVCAKCVHTRCM
jgi:hypothetical protein